MRRGRRRREKRKMWESVCCVNNNTCACLPFKAGGDIDVKFVQKFTDQTMTSVAEDDPWFQVPP